ncbi:MAG: AIPR family protein [Clostridium sp.]|uniref:AIPR family protein n=1 Tax=Clostridium sp. TaxID=1506 RepID=UPI003D6D7B25
MSSNKSISRTKKENFHENVFDQELANNINISINEYITKEGYEGGNTQLIGERFCEWVLYNLFELREDEVLEAISIGGKYDNGIDAVFEISNELYVVQCKYKTSHSIDAMCRFESDCKRLIVEEPLTNRSIVKEKCTLIRETHENKDTIHCYYVTNTEFQPLDKNQIKKNIYIDTNVNTYNWDITNMVDKLEEIKGLLPKKFRNAKFTIILLKNSEMDDNTIVASVSLNELAKFVKAGDNMIFMSNIRNYLNKTKINKKIEETIEKDPEKFWYYNNGITIVCKDYELTNQVINMTEPQIVNGCQTAKSILSYFKTKTTLEKNKNNKGKILIKIIRVAKKSNNEKDMKELKDNITRYTNSQNAIRGLDFYALDQFQRELKIKFEKLGYFYEIQRGAYVTLKIAEQKKYKGDLNYNYLLYKKYTYVLPAKEVIQAFTAGIRQMPNVAYGHAGELTPTGNQWQYICNEETKSLSIEYFLFPYLLLTYIKNNNGYKPGVGDFRKSSSLLFIATYFMFICEIYREVFNYTCESPLDINVEVYRSIFKDEKINKELINIVDTILHNYFEDSKIDDDYVKDDLKGFLKTSIKKDVPWSILEKKVNHSLNKAKDKGITKKFEEVLNKLNL